MAKIYIVITIWYHKNTNFYPSHPDHGRIEKINLNFFFHSSLLYLKWFYEGLKGLHKTF